VLPIRKTSLKMVVKIYSEVNRHPGLAASILDGQDCSSSRVTSGAPAIVTAPRVQLRSHKETRAGAAAARY
jgi:hypothetical protein